MIVGDYDVEIAQGASIADPLVGVVESGVVLDVRAAAHITRVVELQAVVASLAALTGGRAVGAAAAAPASESLGDWPGWWEAEAARWRAVGFARGDG